MAKPVRSARRFIRRHDQKGKRKGKGKGDRGGFRGKGGYHTYLAGLPNEEVESLYKGMAKAKGRGKGKGKKPDGTYWGEQTYYNRSSKSSGKGGFGRQQNPTGPDGNTMECWDCGSTQHLSKDPRCPNKGQGKGKGGYHVNPAVTEDWAQAEQPSGPQTGANTWHVAQPGGAGILEGVASVWVISEDPIADAQQAAAFANAFPSSGDLDLHQEVRRLRQELAITQGEVVDTDTVRR